MTRPDSDRPNSTDFESNVLDAFHPAVQTWFRESFTGPTGAQRKAWPSIANGDNTLLLAPTGSGKTLAAFLVAINRLMFARESATPYAVSGSEKQTRSVPHDRAPTRGVSTLYISPLKALGVDVERNLRSPLEGIRSVCERDYLEYQFPSVGVRSGDTPPSERHRMTRQPPDILITTPESLYLLLTSKARSILSRVETVIIDEIHSLVQGKRGAHLFVSLERLEQLRRANGCEQPLQRVGLSATQRPLDEVARLLGGANPPADDGAAPQPRSVNIVEAGRRKQLELSIEVPVEDMARLAIADGTSESSNKEPKLPTIWDSIHARLVELIREHRSTMLFVNSRLLAERLATAINDLAEEEIAAAHHGSIAKESRVVIESRLKEGTLPAIVATSSLELGIDMGAVDLVVQIEAPPSIASGLQRIGRAGHQVGASSKGVIYPKFRGDLLACSAAVDRMLKGEVEETFYPRNPLDVLAQQIVAMVAMDSIKVDDLFCLVRCAAPFADLPRNVFESVLDFLSGRYPSNDFAELRPRINWDRISGVLTPRQGAQRIAISNAGTIPDRGLYGVFLASGTTRSTRRVGELDEEMVFETQVGDVFQLGVSTWRAVEITHDRVLVVPAPGEPARLPFWRGEGPGRPLEFGRAIGSLSRSLIEMDRPAAEEKLRREHRLDELAARNLMDYLIEQVDATQTPPTDTTLIVESFRDEVGDWRVVLLSPFGRRIHAPWAIAVAAKVRREASIDIDLVWNDDGIVFRIPNGESPPEFAWFVPESSEIEAIVTQEVGATAMFASLFRENAGRALLLPKRQPGRRTPLWLQRRRSADLLQVASRFDQFPIVLETYRECLQDVFDLKGVIQILKAIESRTIRIRNQRNEKASPFASALLFSYTGNFLYENDTPLAERRAATLALDHAQLRELLGDSNMRELLDADVIQQVGVELRRLDQRFVIKNIDAIHDLLISLGELTRDEILSRCDANSDDPHSNQQFEGWIDQLIDRQRIIPIRISQREVLIAAEDAARYRDALGCSIPNGLPESFLESDVEPFLDLISRYARTHVPFKADDIAERFGIGIAPVTTALRELATQGRLLEGGFTPSRGGSEWCDIEVLKRIKLRTLANLRRQVQPVGASAYARFTAHWHGLHRKRRGLDGLLDVIEQLQGAPLPVSDLESVILPARIDGYQPSALDELFAAGEVVWRGVERVGPNDGRIALFLTDHATTLAPKPQTLEDSRAERIVELLGSNGALFFDAIHRELGDFPNDVLESLWRAIWAGHVTNDTLAPLRSLLQSKTVKRAARRRHHQSFRSRRVNRLIGSEGRWSVFGDTSESTTDTERHASLAAQLIERHGIVTRESLATENVVGGFAGIYPVYKAMEESGRVRRGFFVEGLGASQFASPGAEDQLRDQRKTRQMDVLALSAEDPANPYGSALRWPEVESDNVKLQRVAGATVILRGGDLLAYLSKSGRSLQTFLPADEQEYSYAIKALIDALKGLATEQSPFHVEKINGANAEASPLSDAMLQEGFRGLSKGLIYRFPAA